MDSLKEMILSEKVVSLALIEIKLILNHNLFQRGAITEEMFTKAKDFILKGE